jgi:O-antigen/teichoic acid export membrane protein
LAPTFSNLSAARDGATVELLFLTATRLIGMIIIPIAFIAAIIAQPLVQVVYGPAYAAAAGPFAVLMSFNIAGAMTGVAVMALYGMGEQRVVLVKDGIGAAINLLLNLTLTGAWGLWGAVAANSAAQLVSCAIVWHHVSQRFDLTPLSGMLARVVASSVIAAALARLVVNIVPGAVGLMSAGLLAVAVYGGGVWLTGAFGRQDWRALKVEAA